MRIICRFMITALMPALAFPSTGFCEKAQRAAGAAPASVSGELSQLSDNLRRGIQNQPGIKLAVLDFAYINEKGSDGPVIVQERLTTLLAQDKNIVLIERNLMKRVLGELKLQASGAVSDETVRQVGKLLGAAAVVAGTLNDLPGDDTEINARIIDAETGKILSASSAVVKRTWQTRVPPAVEDPGRDFAGKPLVQIALLLDTSNSMDGLINQARNQLWKIINELNASEKSGSSPVIEVAVYEYGNSGLRPETGWIRQVLPFTRNLDRVAEQIFALKTNGGDEYCGKAINDAVNELAWSPKDDVYKAIFIAGNEPFTQGSVDFRQAVSLAKARGIFVNTIFCGRRQEGMATQWMTAAQLAEGEYSSIDQSAPASAINAPQDAQIARLSGELDTTYIGYGARGRDELSRKQALENNIVSSGAAGIMSERGVFKAMAPAAMMQQEASWDVITAIENGSMKREEVKKDQLPEEFRKLSKAQLYKQIDDKLSQRRKIKEEIVRLQADRVKFISEEEKKQANSPSTLDKAVLDAVRSQAVKKGYKFTR